MLSKKLEFRKSFFSFSIIYALSIFEFSNFFFPLFHTTYCKIYYTYIYIVSYVYWNKLERVYWGVAESLEEFYSLFVLLFEDKVECVCVCVCADLFGKRDEIKSGTRGGV